MRIVHVDLNDELEYYVEFCEEETFSAEDLKRFLERQMSGDESDYVKHATLRGLSGLKAIQESSFPLISIGDACRGSNRITIVNGEFYQITLGLISIHSIGE